MKKISGKRSEDDAKIDLTPMLDVVFILLIFFVVTATFLSETSISAASSDNNNNETIGRVPSSINTLVCRPRRLNTLMGFRRKRLGRPAWPNLPPHPTTDTSFELCNVGSKCMQCGITGPWAAAKACPAQENSLRFWADSPQQCRDEVH